MTQQDPGEEPDEDAGKLLKEKCTSESTRSRRGARRRFEKACERKHAPVLVTQQDPGEKRNKDSNELLKRNMYY